MPLLLIEHCVIFAKRRALCWAAIITKSSHGSARLDFCQYSWWIPADFTHWSWRFLSGVSSASLSTVGTNATWRKSFVQRSLHICVNVYPSIYRETSQGFGASQRQEDIQRRNLWEEAQDSDWSAKMALSLSSAIIIPITRWFLTLHVGDFVRTFDALLVYFKEILEDNRCQANISHRKQNQRQVGLKVLAELKHSALDCFHIKQSMNKYDNIPMW